MQGLIDRLFADIDRMFDHQWVTVWYLDDSEKTPGLPISRHTVRHTMFRRLIAHPALALGSTLIWGAVELLALLRLRCTGAEGLRRR